METKTCSICKTEKYIEDFHIKYTECTNFRSKRSLKRYYESSKFVS